MSRDKMQDLIYARFERTVRETAIGTLIIAIIYLMIILSREAYEARIFWEEEFWTVVGYVFSIGKWTLLSILVLSGGRFIGFILRKIKVLPTTWLPL